MMANDATGGSMACRGAFVSAYVSVCVYVCLACVSDDHLAVCK